jgi:hypothetical protein
MQSRDGFGEYLPAEIGEGGLDHLLLSCQQLRAGGAEFADGGIEWRGKRGGSGTKKIPSDTGGAGGEVGAS